jgi:hypothetical protein
LDVLVQIIYRRRTMPRTSADLIQKELDLLALKALALGPLHRLGISRPVEQRTISTALETT